MIIKKLAVPFINDKLLSQAEHCSIATAAISEQGFEFIRTRIPPKCKIDIVTGLNEPTSPVVMERIWQNYQGRIDFRIYTKNVFHANVYILDLPYRKAVAFAGSGSVTLEGLKDHEEIFWRITDPKEIENLKSWFTGYFEFSSPLSEELMKEYRTIYPSLRQREIQSREERNDIIDLTARGFNWDSIKFKNQFFKKEDYLTFSNDQAKLINPVVQTQRESLREKLIQLHGQIQTQRGNRKPEGPAAMTTMISPADHPEGQIKEISLIYGRREEDLKKYPPFSKYSDLMTLRISIRQKSVSVALVPGKIGEGKIDREHFQGQMLDADFRKSFYEALRSLGTAFTIEVAGEKKDVTLFQNEDALYEFIRHDQWSYFSFIIANQYEPDSTFIRNENIAQTLSQDLDKLLVPYRMMMK